MILLGHLFLRLLVAASLLLVLCEFLVYYLVEAPCSWPALPAGRVAGGDGGGAGPLQALFLADTHLLGSRRGHWFDKLRREWQMERAFQAAVTLARPEVVFVLGDLTDEGKWASDEEFTETVGRFRRMFRVPDHVEFHVVIGNHDIGFHESVNRNKLTRFQDTFDLPPVKILTIKDNIFVVVNSMAMHGDSCFMCSPAADRLRQASERLNCSRFGSPTGRPNEADKSKRRCQSYQKLPDAAPILLQHFPLYRPHESSCQGPDEPARREATKRNRERFDVLSQAASQQLLSWIQPRLILSGHTHHGCYVVHQGSVPEISVPSFSWRNRNNPSFVLATISKDDFAYNKCFIPEETTVITIYVFFVTMILVWFVLAVRRNWGRNCQRLNKLRTL